MPAWIPTTLLVILLAMASFIGGGMLAMKTQTDRWSALVVGQVTLVRCGEKGCSLLVVRDDSSTDWVWVPRVEPLRTEKR